MSNSSFRQSWRSLRATGIAVLVPGKRSGPAAT
jgi:hypothetical protein